MSKEITALDTQKSGYLCLAGTDLGATMAEELDGLEISFDKIKIPSGGGLAFEVPGEDGEADTVKDFSAVILFHHAMNAFYKTPFNGGNNTPDCGSLDGIIGVGDPGGNCKTCPLNEFRSGKNGGKACQNRHRLFLLREGESFPMILSLPASSLVEFANYVKRLISKNRKPNAVATSFSLKKATSKGGVVYSKAHFAVDRPLSPEEHALIEKLSEQVRAYSKQVAFDYDNAAEEGMEDINVDPETGRS